MRSDPVRLGSALVLFLLLLFPRASSAFFELSAINEIMTRYDGNPSVQFVDIRMLSSFQNSVSNTVLGAFDAQGNYVGDVLVVPANLSRSGIDFHWLMATSEFATVTGLTPDFIMPASLPIDSGMVCWGAPGNSFPPAPDTWDHSDPANYVDCVAYGNYTGPTNTHIGVPTPLTPDGHSLVRVTETNDNATDFACSELAAPTTNTGVTVSLPATTPCPVTGDVNGDGKVDGADIDSLVTAIFSDSPPPAADVNVDTRVNAADIPALLNLL
jgi:Dockerin type I domain